MTELERLTSERDQARLDNERLRIEVARLQQVEERSLQTWGLQVATTRYDCEQALASVSALKQEVTKLQRLLGQVRATMRRIARRGQESR